MTTLERVAKVFGDTLDCDAGAISKATVPDDVPGWDSVGHMSLVSSLEDEFGVEFDVDDIMEMTNVAKIVEIVEARSTPSG